MQPRRDWFVTSGAHDLKQQSTLQYQDYLQLTTCRTSPPFEEDVDQIELDLARTDESIRLFLLLQDDSATWYETAPDNDAKEIPRSVRQDVVATLRNILRAYSVRNSRVGYVQGHADVLCFLLGHVNQKRDEEETFWVYASVIERVFPEDFFARTPKLHGFQVDCKLYYELAVRKLVPLYPFLAKVDLPLVTTLLSCKWFVSLWVGEVPLPLLYEVWDTMLGEEDGTILHLLIALQYFKIAIDKIQLYMETEQWDSSYIYKIILEECRNTTNISPQTLLQQARTSYGLKDDSVENMREAIRRLPFLRKAEFTVLAKQAHFNQLEMTRLQDEFTFLRFQRKVYCRSKLRGLRQDDIENILAREFNTWPVGMYDLIYRFLKPDGYGNISYYSLIRFLSVASRGTPKEKAHLLFQIVNHQCREYLNQQGIQQLADLLCCLLANRIVADADGSQVHKVRQIEHRRSVFGAAKSPLLRRHFRKKLLSLATLDGQLQFTQWLEHALADSEISQLIARENTEHQLSRMISRCSSFWEMTPIPPTLRRALSESVLHHHQRNPQDLLAKASGKSLAETAEQLLHVKKCNVSAAPFLKTHTENEGAGKRRISLLSNEMTQKFEKSWPFAEAEVQSVFGEPSDAACTGSPYVFWCQCTIS